jgi:CheY-like chemotaxis protein
MSPTPHQASILIVEDMLLIAEEVGEVVRSVGYSVVGTTPSVSGGLKILERQRIDGAILDIDLGGHTSYPLCRVLQARGIPFVFLTGHSPANAVPIEFRHNRHLDKPIDRRKLKSALDSLLRSGSTLPKFGNQILDDLATEQRRAVSAHLEAVVLKSGDLLDAEGQEVSHVYFPVNALISIFAGNSRGQGIEATSIGRHGMTAPNVLLDDKIALGDTVVQMGGSAWRIPVLVLHQLAEGDTELRSYLFGQIRLALRDILDTSSSAGRFSIIERLARWLVQAEHKVGAQRFDITHAALATILAVRRPSVTLGLQTIEGHGLIRSTRRVIVVRDLKGLTDLARLNGRS